VQADTAPMKEHESDGSFGGLSDSDNGGAKLGDSRGPVAKNESSKGSDRQSANPRQKGESRRKAEVRSHISQDT